MHVARAIFSSGCPLSLVENSYWQKAFAVLRPAYKIPSRYLLTNFYLEEEYGRIKCKCQEYLQKATSVAILCDGWTNIRYAVQYALAIQNYMGIPIAAAAVQF